MLLAKMSTEVVTRSLFESDGECASPEPAQHKKQQLQAQQETRQVKAQHHDEARWVKAQHEARQVQVQLPVQAQPQQCQQVVLQLQAEQPDHVHPRAKRLAAAQPGGASPPPHGHTEGVLCIVRQRSLRSKQDAKGMQVRLPATGKGDKRALADRADGAGAGMSGPFESLLPAMEGADE